MTLALIAWVCLAPVLRVLEDADFLILEGCVVHLSDHPSPLGSMVGGHCVIESSSRSSI